MADGKITLEVEPVGSKSGLKCPSAQRAGTEFTGALCAIRTPEPPPRLKPGKWMERCNFSVFKSQF